MIQTHTNARNAGFQRQSFEYNNVKHDLTYEKTKKLHRLAIETLSSSNFCSVSIN